MWSAQQQGNQLRVFNAETGAPYFTIQINGNLLSGFFINGNTLSINYSTGITEIWNLANRSKIR